jgi:hypothetical protein
MELLYTHCAGIDVHQNGHSMPVSRGFGPHPSARTHLIGCLIFRGGSKRKVSPIGFVSAMGFSLQGLQANRLEGP